MSDYQQQDLRGSIFRNERKREGKQDPDYTGSALIGGAEYFVDGWVNEAKTSGKKYLALKFKAKERKPASEPAKAAPPADDFNDDIPFAFVLAAPLAGLLAAALAAATSSGMVA